MPHLIQNNWTAGEWSERLYAREDVANYANASAVMLNMLPYPQGPATRRMGTIFVNTAKFGDRPARLIRFIFGREDAYILEVGDGYTRIHRARGTVFDGEAEYEFATPWTADQLDELAWTQSADTIYVVHPDVDAQKITRTSNTNWTVTTSTGIGRARAICFYQQRLVISGRPNEPQKLYFSDINGFENFAGSGADQGFGFTLASDRVNTILWIMPNQRNLMVGTQGDVWTISPPDTAAGLASDNIEARRASGIGCHDQPAAAVDNDVFFISRSKRQVRAAAFDITVDSYDTPEQSVFAEHLAKRGLQRIAYQAEPDGVLWMPAEDGSLIGATVLKAQKVNAWHQHYLGGRLGRENAVVEDVAVIPSPNGAIDDVWLLVRRTINGAEVRHIEYMADPFRPTTAQDRDGMVYVDASVSIANFASETFTLSGGTTWKSQDTGILDASAAHFSTIGERIRLRARGFDKVLRFCTVRVDAIVSPTQAAVTFLQDVPPLLQGYAADQALLEINGVAGAGHLEGETVRVLVDGAPHEDRVVTAGGFDLQFPGFEVRCGLPFTSRLVSLFFSPTDPARGDTQGAKKRISQGRIDFDGSLGVKVGTIVDGTPSALDQPYLRESDDSMDAPPDLFSGMRQIPLRGGHGRKVQIVLEQDDAQPLTVRAVSPFQETY